MSSVFAHVDPDVQPLLLQSNGDRISFIEQSGFVEWPQATEALSAILALGEADPVSEPRFIMIHGGPRSGRSAVLEEAHRRLSMSYPLERRSMLINTPTSHLEARLVHQVLVTGQVPNVSGRTLSRQRSWAIAGLQREGGRLLLADNLHNAAPNIRVARVYLPIWLAFCDDARVDGVFTTIRRPADLLAADPQLEARTMVMTLSKWPAQRWVAEVVELALRRYPLRLPTKVTGEFMEVLHGSTGGIPGRAFGRLKDAARLAIHSGQEAISPDVIRKVASGRPV